MVLCIYLIQERTNGLPYRLAANIANPEYRSLFFDVQLIKITILISNCISYLTPYQLTAEKQNKLKLFKRKSRVIAH